jgi:predicted dienelactone hydrolase
LSTTGDTKALFGTYGEHKHVLPVGTVELVLLWDPARKKDLALRVVYPKEHTSKSGEAPVASPVIIFSHGAGGDKDGYSTWTHYWASHGYICLSPTHQDALVLRPGTSRKDELTKIVSAVDTDFDGWSNRALDISFVVDALPKLSEMIPEIAGRIDGKAIAIAGHSYGAHTSMLIAGATVNGNRSFSDKRISACLVMSPQGPGRSGLTESSFAQISIPAFFMTGSRDLGPHGEDVNWRRRAYELSVAQDKYQGYFHGATHLSFARRRVLGTSAPTISPADWPFAIAKADLKEGKISQQTISRWIKMTSLAFFDAHLKSDSAASELLHSRQFAEQSEGGIEWSFK